MISDLNLNLNLKNIENRDLNLRFGAIILQRLNFWGNLVNTFERKNYNCLKSFFHNQFHYNHVKINFRKKYIDITKFLYLKYLLKTLKLILKFNSTIFYFKTNQKKKINIFFGGGIDRSGIKKISNCLKNYKSEPFQKNFQYIVYSSKLKSQEGIITDIYPLQFIFKSKFSVIEKFFICMKINIKLFSFIIKSFFDKKIILLFEDYLDLSIYEFLKEKNFLNSVISDVSYFGLIPLWINEKKKNHSSFFLWDTINPLHRITFKKCGKYPKYDFYFPFIKADKHFLTINSSNNIEKKILQKIYAKPVKVCKPLENFYSNHFSKNKVKKNEVVISIFDCGILDEIQIADCKINSFYSLDTMKKFVTDIVNVVNKINKIKNKKYKIFIKRKNDQVTGDSDFKYFEFLNLLSAKNKNFKVLSNKSDIRNLIKVSDLTITIPFSNPGFLSQMIYKTKSIYYDPYNKVDNTIRFSKINLINTERKLMNIIKKL